MSMTGHISSALLASVVGLTMACMPAIAQQPQKPNVVFILADNVGYGDLGPYGARVCASRSIWSNPAAHHRARRS